MLKSNKTLRKFLNVLIVFVVLGLPLYIGHMNGKKFDSNLLKDSVITNGTIFDYEHVIKHSPAFKYRFDLDGNTYQGESSNEGNGGAYPALSSRLIGKSFPVIASKSDPKTYNKILITPADFENYKLQYPDSLKWVKIILDNVR